MLSCTTTGHGSVTSGDSLRYRPYTFNPTRVFYHNVQTKMCGPPVSIPDTITLTRFTNRFKKKKKKSLIAMKILCNQKFLRNTFENSREKYFTFAVMCACSSEIYLPAPKRVRVLLYVQITKTPSPSPL